MRAPSFSPVPSFSPGAATPAGVAFAATVGNGVGLTAAIMATFGVFLVPIATEFGWGRASVSGVLALIALVMSALYPSIGRAMDRFGSRRLLIGFPILLLFLHDAPRHAATAAAPLEGLTLREAAQTRAFRLMLVAIAAAAGGMTAVFTHVVPMLTDHGVGLGKATGVVAVFALVTAGWQMVTGALLDKYRTPRIIAPMFATAILGLLLLEFGSGTAAIMTAGALLGIGMGAEYGALGYFISRYFGLKHYGSIIGGLY